MDGSVISSQRIKRRQYETEKQTDIHRKVLEMLFCPGIHVHCCDSICRDRCRSPGTSGGNGNLIFWMVLVLIPGVSGIHSSGCCICQIREVLHIVWRESQKLFFLSERLYPYWMHCFQTGRRKRKKEISALRFPSCCSYC